MPYTFRQMIVIILYFNLCASLLGFASTAFSPGTKANYAPLEKHVKFSKLSAEGDFRLFLAVEGGRYSFIKMIDQLISQKLPSHYSAL